MIFVNQNRKDEIIQMLSPCNCKCNSTDYFKNLEKLGESLKKEEEFKQLATFAVGIASNERLIILNSLKDRDRCVCELEVILNKSQPTISHHLRKLERAKLIKGYKKGNYSYYGLNKENVQRNIEILQKLL